MLTQVLPEGAVAAERNLDKGLGNGVTFDTDVTPAERTWLEDHRGPFALYSAPESADVAVCEPAGSDEVAGYPTGSDEVARDVLTSLGAPQRDELWRLILPEFDQMGGCWAEGRPEPSGNPAEALRGWMDYYWETKGLRGELAKSVAARGYRTIAVCVFAFCPQYAYDLGVDTVLLERNNDEVSGISPGIALARGAAVQNGRDWGIDISTWRYWNDGASSFDHDGTLLAGWSPSMVSRHLYMALGSGAHVVLMEASQLYDPSGDLEALSPLGRALRSFNRFALVRHPGARTPVVTMAFLQQHESGYEPRYGQYNQAKRSWYGAFEHGPGDRELTHLLDVAFPGHRTWGTIPPGAPWVRYTADEQVDVEATTQAYRDALAAGADPRPWEPMGTARWGQTIDVITDRAPAEALERYPSIVLSTPGNLPDDLTVKLGAYVRAGGTLVLSSSQMSESAQALAGVTRTGRTGEADSAIVPDGSRLAEDRFRFEVVTPTTATVVARTESGEPLITRNSVGAGRVYLATPHYLTGQGGTALLRMGTWLLDELQAEKSPVSVDGPPVEYLISRVGADTVVTLVNNAGTAWVGSVDVEGSAGRASEWVTDKDLPARLEGDATRVRVTVPAYGVRVVAVRS
ncbi:MAG: hypothetical protein WCF04_10895 [Candidatus Nanopelagicales bacterium]